MFGDTIALTARSLRKWIRNPAAVLPGLFTSLFYLALFGSSFNPTSLIPSNIAGFQLSPPQLAQIKASILSQTFGGASTYITYLTAGIICLILVFNMAFGGIDLVLDRQLGYLNTLLTSPITRASIFFSGVAQNMVKALSLAVLTFMIALILPNGLILGRGFGVVDLVGAFAAFTLFAFALSCAFTALAFMVKSIDSLVAIANFVTFPLIFMSDALFPASGFPSWLSAVSNVNPVTKTIEVARLLMVNGTLTASQAATVSWDFAYLVAFAMVLAAVGYLAAKRVLKAD
ncbi:MAG TPA: ABC transporter permease [Nitrososphaerales archaeon]|nr:ABC transporter permease [Nitrososphaerales archaeon]